MHRRNRWNAQAAGSREMQVTVMEMDKIETFGALNNLLDFDHISSCRIFNRRIGPQGAFGDFDQLCARCGPAACKQSDIVAQPYQFFCQVRYDALCAAVRLGRYGLN
jgi:hypothetical protein